MILNIRQASATDGIGIVCHELDGPRAEIKAAIKWLEKHGLSIEPVEINGIKSSIARKAQTAWREVTPLCFGSGDYAAATASDGGA